MSVLLDAITVGELKILVLDSAPNGGAGYPAEIGSLAIVQGQSGIYQKSNTVDTDWIISSVNAEDVEDIVGGMLLDTSTIDLTYNDGTGDLSADVVLGSLDNSHIAVAAAIDATKIASGLVDNTEFGYLNGVTSAIQTQLDNKAALVHTHVSTDITDFTEAAQDAVGSALVDSATVDFTYNDGANTITAAVIQSGIDHGSISGLSDDDHSQYALLAGRSGGQIVNGDTASAGNLELHSTANATKGKILLGSSVAVDEANTRLGVGTASPESILQIESSNVKFNIIENSTTTSGSVNAVVGSVTTASNSVEFLKVYVTGLRTNGANESVAYERTVRVKNNGGTVSLPTIQSDYTSEDAALNAANCTFIVNGSAVDVRVTGVAAADITWKVVIQRMR